MTRNFSWLVLKLQNMNQNRVNVKDKNYILQIESFVKSKNKLKENKIDIFRSKFIKTEKNSMKVKKKLQKNYPLENSYIKGNSKGNFIVNYISIALGIILLVFLGYLEVRMTTSIILFAIAFSSLVFGGLYNNNV